MRGFRRTVVMLILLALLPIWGQLSSDAYVQGGDSLYAKADAAQQFDEPAQTFFANLTVLDVAFDPVDAQPGDEVTITVTIQNNGNEDIFDAFFVDLYLNPETPITTGEIAWLDLESTLDSTEGIEWVVEGLAADETLELTSTPDSYDGEFTEWSGQLPVGLTDLYVYVDVYALLDDTESLTPENGLIEESDETDNAAHITFGDTQTEPTIEPTMMPTPVPTFAPTGEPTVMPTAVPTFAPTVEPTAMPTAVPTIAPTSVPQQDQQDDGAVGQSNANLTIQELSLNPDNPQPGEAVSISLVVANTGSEDVTEAFYVDLYINPTSPVNQGGSDWTQLDSSVTPKQGIEWSVDGLNAGATIELTSNSDSYDEAYTNWSGSLPFGATDLYFYVDSWADNGSPNGLIRESNETDNGEHFVIEVDDSAPQQPTPVPPTPTPTATTPPVPPSQPTPDSSGGDSRFEASINFRPNPNGFKFENWGGTTYSDAQDLNPGQLIRMFGASNVCRTGSTAQDCVLTAAARQWREQELKGVAGGHCYGMAVASQRFFNNSDSPSNFQAGINQTIGLDPQVPIRASITEWAVSQSFTPANGSSNQWNWGSGQKPSQILDLIRQQFNNNPNDPYVFAFFQEGQGGHAVTPYGIENKGNGIYWLYFYDNNWPDKERYMIFDTNRETWLYSFGALNPAEQSGAWQGDARTQSLALRPTSAHLTSGWACPFCNSDEFARQGATPMLEFNLTGEGGAMLIVDPNNKAVGYDFETEQEINELSDAVVSENIGGQGQELVPTYRLPVVTDGMYPWYDVYVAARYLTGTVDSDLQINGPGFSVGLEFIQISEGEDLLITVSPDGRQLTFNASEEGLWGPDIYFALDPDPEGDSYIFSIEGFVLESFKTITTTIDLDTKQLLFEDDDGASDTYALEVLRIDKDGNEFFFSNDAVEVGAEDEAAMDFGSWDGESDMRITIGGTTQTFQSTLPTEPTEPTEPTQPTEPAEPTQPTQPTEPAEPEQGDETMYSIYLPVLRK
ncbi:MAG: CARDB domain-containing protein [Chloroflexota bacterium]